MFYLGPSIGIESKNVAVSATSVNYVFDPFHDAPFIGYVLASLQSLPAGTADTLPVTFGGVAVLRSDGAAATVADLGGATLVQLYYNSNNKRLQLVGNYAAAAAAATPAATPAAGGTTT